MKKQTTDHLLVATVAIGMVIASVWRIPVVADFMRISFQVIFEMVVMVCLGVVVYSKANKWVGAYLVLATINIIFPFFTKESFVAGYAVLVGCLWYLIIVIGTDIDSADAFLDAMVVIALVHIIMQCLQVLGYDPLFFNRHGGRNTTPVGLMSNAGETAALIAFCAPAFCRKKYWLGVIPVLGGLVLVKATMGIIAVASGGVAAIVILSSSVKKSMAVVVVSAVCLLGYFKFIDMPGIERWEVWTTGIKMWKEHWLVGGGLGHWKVFVNFLINDHRWMTAHNEYIQALFEQGIFFVVILAGYLYSTVKRAWSIRQYICLPICALVIVLVNCVGNFAMHIAPTAMLAITWMAILEVSIRHYAYEA